MLQSFTHYCSEKVTTLRWGTNIKYTTNSQQARKKVTCMEKKSLTVKRSLYQRVILLFISLWSSQTTGCVFKMNCEIRIANYCFKTIHTLHSKKKIILHLAQQFNQVRTRHIIPKKEHFLQIPPKFWTVGYC